MLFFLPCAQAQLEQSFFAKHSPSLQRTVDFVSDRVMSNYIKRFQATTHSAHLRRGHVIAVSEAVACLDANQHVNAEAKVYLWLAFVTIGMFAIG